MQTKLIKTTLGDIFIHSKVVDGTLPIVFLHGVYFDHNLWNYQIDRIKDRTVIAMDMPFHGGSRLNHKQDWTPDDCAPLIGKLRVPVIALKGREDYVPKPKHLNTFIVEGGHVSPVEVPEEVYNFVLKVTNMKTTK